MDTNTVLVIGAGASVPFGLPTGEDLVHEVQKGLSEAPPHPNSPEAGLQQEGGGAESRWRNRTSQAKRRLVEAQPESIDDYLQDTSSDDADLIRVVAARVLAEKEKRAVEHEGKVKGDWVAWLYNNALKYRCVSDFAQNRVVIVSFNYDRMPQFRLANMMSNRHQIYATRCFDRIDKEVCIDDANSVPRFWHVHGCLRFSLTLDESGMKVIPGVDEHQINQLADKLLFMGLPSGKDEAGSLAKSCESLWDWAGRVLCLGIGYHENNMETIGLTKETVSRLKSEGKFVGGTAFQVTHGRNQQLKNRMGPDFVFGDGDEDCQAYLENYLELR